MSYTELVSKVGAFSSSVHEARASDMRCGPGCASCCRVELTVCRVEGEEVARGIAGLNARVRARLAERASVAPIEGGPCVMLDGDRCVVYERRPLVCRTQGLALAYPPGFVPEAAVRAKDARGHDVTWCPLNFEGAPPRPREVLDAGRLDELLALIERLRVGEEHPGRISIRELAREATDPGR